TVEVARHVRTYDRAKRIEHPSHFVGLVEERPRALVPKTQDRLRAAVPEVDQLFVLLAQRGENIGHNVARLAQLMSIYGVDDFRAAVLEAVERETPRATSIGNIVERRRRARS